MTDDDWRKWKNGKLDDRYRGVKRHSGQTNYKKILAIIIPIVVIGILLLVIPAQGMEDFVSKSLANLSNLSNSANTNSLTNNALKPVPNSILTEDNYLAQLVPSNIQVIQKDRYNVIVFSVAVNVQNLPFDGSIYFEDLYTTLQDENSKVYHPDPSECSLNDLIPIIGKETSSANYNVCYSVDKASSKFFIQYTEPLNNYHSYRLGHLSVDSGLFSYYQAHQTSEPITIGTIDLAIR